LRFHLFPLLRINFSIIQFLRTFSVNVGDVDFQAGSIAELKSLFHALKEMMFKTIGPFLDQLHPFVPPKKRLDQGGNEHPAQSSGKRGAKERMGSASDSHIHDPIFCPRV
jgi:hypothetical protein